MPPRKKQKTRAPDSIKRYDDWSQRALEAARGELQAKLAALNGGGAQGIRVQVGEVQGNHHSLGPSTSYALVKHDSPQAPKRGDGDAPTIINRDGGNADIVNELKKELKRGYQKIRKAYSDNTPEDYAAMSRKQLEACAADLTGMLTALGALPDGGRVLGSRATAERHSATGAALEPAVAVPPDTNPFARPAHNASMWWGVQTTIEGSERDSRAIQAEIDTPNLLGSSEPRSRQHLQNRR